LSSWIPAGGEEQLFLSKTTHLREGAAIRGGVPLVFPQFSSMGSLAKHGFARTALWHVVQQGQTESGAGFAILELTENIASLRVWPHVFQARLSVTLQADSMHLEFSVKNTGDTSFNFSCALHTYFAVRQLSDVRIHGLTGLAYWDTVTGKRNCLDEVQALSIQGEIDRIYNNIHGTLEIIQPHQRVSLQQTGFKDAVVWNPGAQKGEAIEDLETGGFAKMLCVEAASIMQPIALTSGQSWIGTQTIQVQ